LNEDENEEDEEDNRISKLRDAVIDLCEGGAVKIYFSNGVTLVQNSLYELQFRDEDFEDIVWADFRSYDRTKEKPDTVEVPDGDNGTTSRTAWNSVGKYEEDRSLFTWVVNEWPINANGESEGPKGYLVCDDGSGEIADFIHLQENDSGVWTLTLIHVKAGKESGRVSTGEHEVVLSQAVKNLRFVDNQNLGDNLSEAVSQKVNGLKWGEKEIRDLVWKDGQKIERSDFIDALSSIGSGHNRKVVVVQPHSRKSYFTSLRQKTDKRDGLKQLDLMLHETKRSCNNLQADFHLVATDDTFADD
jgi:hypothetical protein